MTTNVVIQKRTVSETSATVWGTGGDGGKDRKGTVGRSSLLLYTDGRDIFGEKTNRGRR